MDHPTDVPATPQYYYLRLLFGVVLCILLSVAVMVALFSSGPTGPQYNVLRMLMAAFVAVLVPVFGGGITVRTTGIAAFGGCAVWLLFPHIYGELATTSNLTLFLTVDGKHEQLDVPVTIRFGVESRNVLSSHGEAIFRIPSDVDQIQSITIGDGKDYEPALPGPYPIAKDEALTVDLLRLVSDGPDSTSKTPNEAEVIPDLPTAERVLAHESLPARQIKLSYQNRSRVNLTLWLFNCWRHYEGMEGNWKKLVFPRGATTPELYDDFKTKIDGNGVYGIAVEYEQGKYKYFGCYNLFDSEETILEVSGSNVDSLTLKVVPTNQFK